MATPGRQRPVRPDGPAGSADQTALHAKIATMTYSFAQQMPQLPSRPAPVSRAPPGRPVSVDTSGSSAKVASSDDPNFPLLTRIQHSDASLFSRTSERPLSAPPGALFTSSSAWESAGVRASTPSTASAAGKGSRWSGSTGKVATAAEVVASMPSDQVAVEADDSESAKHQAELALYSKLVPTMSAVPRNPGRSLGGGGLRATGSVAAQKTARLPSGSVALHAPQAIQAIPRKEPMSSRMRSLSSEVSKPQLARRVARPNRNASPTLPSSSAEVESNIVADPRTEHVVDHADLKSAAQTRARESPDDVDTRFLRGIESIYGSIDKDVAEQPVKIEATNPSARRYPNDQGNGLSTNSSLLRTQQTQAARRLNEAFNHQSRIEPARSPSPVPSRKSQIGALRRSSGPSPSPAHMAARKTSGRDSGTIPSKATPKVLSPESSAVPPGFEGRAASGSRASSSVRSRKDADVPQAAKRSDRDAVLPQNSRADAFREAINTRRHSSSPRPMPLRRVSHGDVRNEPIARPSPSTGVTSEEEAPAIRRNESFPPSPLHVNAAKRQEEDSVLRSDGLVKETQRTDRMAPRRTHEDERSSLARSGDSGAFPSAAESEGRRAPPTVRTAGVEVVNSSDTMEEPNTFFSNGRVDNVHRLSSEAIRQGLGQGPSRTASNNFADVHVKTAGSGAVISTTHAARIIPACKKQAEKEASRLVISEKEIEESNAEAFVDNLVSDDEAHNAAKTASSVMNGNVPVATGKKMSMIDLMRQLHSRSNSASTSMMGNSEGSEDVLLPPLPAPEEDVRFESMLRSMGWTPPDEEDTYKSDEAGMSSRSGASRRVRAGVPDLGMSSGMGRNENGRVSSPYYSHFQ